MLYNRQSLVFKEWRVGDMVEEMSFKEALFWVQINDVPLDLLTKKNVEVIENKLGRVSEMEDLKRKTGVGRDFLKV